MKVGVGIDFGTTNSTAALFDGQLVTLVRLDGGEVPATASRVTKEKRSPTGRKSTVAYRK